MKSANSSNQSAAAARAARQRLLLVAPLCLVALACGLLAGVSSRAAGSAAAAQDAPQKAKGGAAAEASGKTDARERATQPGGKVKPWVTKSGGARPLADQIGCATNPQPIALNGGVVNGTLSSGDCANPFDGSFYDAYTFTAPAGQLVIIELTSSAFDTYLYLLRPGETALSYRTIQHDDINFNNGNLNSRLVGVLPGTGNTTYTILANSASPGETGSYQLSVRNVGNCTATNLGSSTTTRNDSLAAGDCQLHDNSFVDVYAFTAAAGQQVSVAMSSNAVDSFLFLLSTDGFTELARNDDGLTGGGNNFSDRGARIPAPDTGQGVGVATLPAAGTYYILANSFSAGETGSYSLTLTVNAPCTTQAITAGQTANGTLATTDCRLPFDGSFMDVYTFAGTAGQQISVTMTSGAFDAYLLLYDPDGFLLDEDNNGAGGTNARIPFSSGTITLPFTGTYRIYANAAAPGLTGAYQLSLSSGSAATCAVSVSPTISPFTQGGGAGRFTVVPDAANPQCAWTASTTATWIAINTGATGSGTNRVTYTVAANNTGATRTATITVNGQTHTVTQTSDATTPAVAFKFANYSVGEADASRSITVAVSRLGDTAGASTVEYRTVSESQQQAEIACNQPVGVAFGRCDFATTVDTLTFLPGEAEKSFTIPLINDVHVEGAETFQVALSDPRGATLGAQTTATVTINDDDTAPATVNPVRPPRPYGPDSPRFFVRMQYLDFLSREPEASEPWTNVLVICPDPENPAHLTNNSSAGCDRILVSKSFFESDENRIKGRFVFLYHKVSFGSAANPNYLPEYRDFVTDLRRVTGATGPETTARRLDYAEDWVTRAAFAARYSGLSNADFVNTLLANVNVTLTQAGSGFTAASLINDLSSGAKSRAEVLRLIVESPETSARQFNHAYVATQYYGYLRRTPDLNGYLAWLNAINDNSQNLRVMVDGFMNSIEYLLRFGPN